MKRLITTLCLIFSLCLCLASFALADATGTVTDDCIRVRTKPSSDAEVYQQLNKGDVVTVLADADQYGWVKVRFTYTEDGTSKVGYMSKDYLSVDGAASSDEAEDDKSKDKTTEQDQQKTDTAASEKQDTSASQQKEDTTSSKQESTKQEEATTSSQQDTKQDETTSSSEQEAKQDETTTASKDADKQDADAQKTETKQDSDTTKEQTASTAKKDESKPEISEEVSLTATVSGSSVNVRKSASKKADSVVTVPEGDIVFVLSGEDANGWMKVRYYDGDGKKYNGYMLGEYLDINAIGTGKSNQTSAIIRETSDPTSAMVGVIPKNGEVNIYASKDGQYRVGYKALSGWVDASCIDAESEDDCYAYGSVTADLLKLRTKRSTESDVITKIGEGTTLQLSEEKNGWYKTNYNGQTGYVSSDYVQDTDTCDKGYIQVTASSLSLRSGAGSNFARLATIPSGEVLKVSGSLGAWYQVTYGKFTGYVSGEYVSATTKDGFSTGSDESDESTAASTAVYITCDALSLRDQASTDGSKLDSLPNGTQVNVLSEEDGWYKVSYNGQIGYINAEFTGSQLTSQSEEESAEASSSDSESEESESASSEEDSSSSESESAPSGSGNSDALAYASQFVGNPYSWGGTSLTNGCDCSGFVMSVFAQYGVSLPHSSSAIRGYGQSVSYSDMQPGDVVCYSGHVGIYAGNGQLLSALNKNKGITYCSVNYKDIITIRRML